MPSYTQLSFQAYGDELGENHGNAVGIGEVSETSRLYQLRKEVTLLD